MRNSKVYSIRKELKSRGFHWSRKEQAWQREFNENTIRAINIITKNILSRKEIQEQYEEFE